jgi:transglutaminase-like putative cysteine protease/tetratricopeptide (TPR) repeat protein
VAFPDRITIPGMLSNCRFFALVPGVLSVVFPACSQVKMTSVDAYSNEAIVFERLETIHKMFSDGTGERDLRVKLRVQSDGAAQQFGVLSFPYASAYEKPAIKLIRVHKADGTTVDTPAADAVDMPTEVSREAPLYSDLKEKHVPVRSLAKGDVLEYEVDTTISKAEAPGQFWGTYHFTPPATIAVIAEVLRLEFPADKYVQVWSPNHKFTTTQHDGVKTYLWDSSQLLTAPKPNGDDEAKPKPPKDPDEDSEGRKMPSVAWTTFHNWQEVGDWYRSLALPQAKPTDALRARAEELTKNAKTPEEQVRLIYTYVSGHTRYIGIDFGIGRYQPHTAAEVFANQYGDCKDKDTLLEAMLQAKGFATAPALMGAGIAPVPDVPLPAVFNHVITTVELPSGRIWLDSTPQAAPYKFLAGVIRDQKALVVPAEGRAELVSTPANLPYAFSARFEAKGILDKEGKLTANMVATYRDDDEVIVRALARNVAAAEWDKASQYVSSITGFGGTTSKTQFQNADDTSSPIVMTYDYARHPFGDWDNLRIVPLFPMLEFPALDSDKKQPDEDIQLGAPRSLTAISRIKLPEGYRPDLPDPIHVKTDFATFEKTYRFEGDEIIAERKIVVLKKKLPKADWQSYQAFTKGISLSNEPWIQLMAPSKPITISTLPSKSSQVKSSKTDKDSKTTTVTLPSEAVKNASSDADSAVSANASISELMDQAQQKMHSMDWSGAKQVLDQVKARNPNQKGLWGSYGIIAEYSDHDLNEAKADFQKEITAQPDNPMVVGAFAEVQKRGGGVAGARSTVRTFLDRHPENVQMAEYLAGMQTSANDYAGALKTYEEAAERNPDNRILRVQEGEMLVQLNRKEEAAAAAKSALDEADEPSILNDAAYVLSKSGLSLDIAEEASRKSISKLEEESAGITTAQVNSKAFADANLLIASWDTLGWILYREGKLEEATPLLSAAWRASLRAEVGDHLGQIYEETGKKDEALTTYILAEAANSPPAPQDVRDHLRDSIARLKGSAAKSRETGGGAMALQNLRTYKVRKPQGASGWGTFRLEITSAGVIESQKMSGEQHIEAVKPVIDDMKFPELIPPGSKAHLLRSAVVSCSMGKDCELVLVPDGGL